MAALTGNRLTLGIGLSHRVTMEGMLGFDWSKPIRHLREYLACLLPLLRGKVMIQGLNVFLLQIRVDFLLGSLISQLIDIRS